MKGVLGIAILAMTLSATMMAAQNSQTFYLGTAALSERDYVHQAIDRADLIVTIGHDTVEKPPFLMTRGRHEVIHIGFVPATVEEVSEWVRAGLITDVKTIIGTFWLEKVLSGAWPMATAE